MRGRFFQRFQQGIERGCREHMHFIDDVNLIPSLVGREIDLIPQGAHIIHAGVRSCVDLDEVKKTPLVDCEAVLTFITGSV